MPVEDEAALEWIWILLGSMIKRDQWIEKGMHPQQFGQNLCPDSPRFRFSQLRGKWGIGLEHYQQLFFTNEPSIMENLIYDWVPRYRILYSISQSQRLRLLCFSVSIVGHPKPHVFRLHCHSPANMCTHQCLTSCDKFQASSAITWGLICLLNLQPGRLPED